MVRGTPLASISNRLHDPPGCGIKVGYFLKLNNGGWARNHDLIKLSTLNAEISCNGKNVVVVIGYGMRRRSFHNSQYPKYHYDISRRNKNAF